MKKKTFIFCLLILSAGIFIPASGGCNSPGEQGVITGDTLKMLNQALSFIKKNHPETSPLINDNIKWTTSAPDAKPGYTSQVYSGGGWTITTGHTITADEVYIITAENKSAGISWTGRMINGSFEETGYQSR